MKPKKKILVIAISLLLLSSFVTSVFAQWNIYFWRNTFSSASYRTIINNYPTGTACAYGSSFMMPEDGYDYYLNYAGFHMQKYGSPWDNGVVYCLLLSLNQTTLAPIDVLEWSTGIPHTSIPTSMAWVNWTFSGETLLEAWTRYGVVLVVQGENFQSSEALRIYYHIADANTYESGLYYSAGSWTVYGTWDCRFEVFGTPIDVPELTAIYESSNSGSTRDLEDEHPSDSGYTSASGQLFSTPSLDYTLNAFEVYVYSSYYEITANVTARLYETSSGVPTGSAIASSGNFHCARLTTAWIYLNFTFTGGNAIDLTPSTTYFVAIEVSCPNVDATRELKISIGSGSGAYYYRGVGTPNGWVSEGSYSLNCKVYAQLKAEAVSSNEDNSNNENGVECVFSCYWETTSPSVYLSGYIFEYGLAGYENNDTWTAFPASTTESWANVSKTLAFESYDLGATVYYRWYLNTSSGRWEKSEQGSFTLQATVTFYFLTGTAAMRRNSTDLVNGTQTTYTSPTDLEFEVLCQAGYGFQQWSWTNTEGSETDNPYSAWTVTNQSSFICNVVAIGGGGGAFIFASFTWTPAVPENAYVVVSFDASASNSSSSITAYQWDFDDGNETEVYTPYITHYWEANGTYTVSLTVVSDVGEVTYSAPVVVGGAGGGMVTQASYGVAVITLLLGSLFGFLLTIGFIAHRRRQSSEDQVSFPKVLNSDE